MFIKKVLTLFILLFFAILLNSETAVLLEDSVENSAHEMSYRLELNGSWYKSGSTYWVTPETEISAFASITKDSNFNSLNYVFKLYRDTNLLKDISGEEPFSGQFHNSRAFEGEYKITGIATSPAPGLNGGQVKAELPSLSSAPSLTIKRDTTPPSQPEPIENQVNNPHVHRFQLHTLPEKYLIFYNPDYFLEENRTLNPSMGSLHLSIMTGSYYETGSGFNRYETYKKENDQWILHNNFFNPMLNLINFPITQNGSTSTEFYKIDFFDNLNNKSTSYYQLEPDSEGPIIADGKMTYKIDGNSKTSYGLEYELVEITDELTEVDDLVSYAYKKEEQENYTNISINDNTINLINLQRGSLYTLKISAKDNVGNETVKESSIYQPLIPYIDQESVSWNWTAEDTVNLNLNLLFESGSSINQSNRIFNHVENLKLFLNSNELELDLATPEAQTKGTTGYLYTIPVNWEMDISGDGYVFHQPQPLEIKLLTIYGEENIYQVDLKAIRNRTPDQSSISSFNLSIGNNTRELKNESSLYINSSIDSENDLPSRIETFISENRFQENWYYNSSEEFLTTGATITIDPTLTDADGDNIIIESLLYEGNEYLILTERVIEENIGRVLAKYLLPIKLMADNDIPGFSGITIAEAEGNPIFLKTPQNPQDVKIKITGINADDSGLGQVEIRFSEILDSREHEHLYMYYTIPSNESGAQEIEIPWPEEISLVGNHHYLIDCSLQDRLGKKELDSQGDTVYQRQVLHIDNTVPIEPNNGKNLILSDKISDTDSTDDLKAYYFTDQGRDNIKLYFHEAYFNNPLQVVSATFIIDQQVYSQEIESTTQLNNSLRITLKPDYNRDTELNLDCELSDRAGNSKLCHIQVATPAEILSDELFFSGVEPIDIDEELIQHRAEGFEINLSHADIVNPGWTSVNIIRTGLQDTINYPLQSQSWTDNGAGLSPHGIVTYQITPINKSREPGETLSLQKILTNHAPQANWTNQHLQQNQGMVYLGPNSRISYSLTDEDDDLVESRLMWKLQSEESFKELHISEEPEYRLNAEQHPFTSGNSYTLQLELRDSYERDLWEGGIIISPWIESASPFSFIYDKSAPEVTNISGEVLTSENASWIKRNPSDWAMEGLSFRCEDKEKSITGIGTQFVLAEFWEEASDNQGPPSESRTLQIVDGAIEKLFFPEGEYQLTLTTQDLLGNKSQPYSLKTIYNDITPPVIAPIEMTSSKHVAQQDLILLEYPVISVKIEGEDTLSGLSRVEYRFLEGEKIIYSGEKNIFDPKSDIPEFLYAIPSDLVKSGSEYTLEFCLVDCGENKTAWTAFPKKLGFNLTPVLVEVNTENWNLIEKEEVYLTNKRTLPLPEVSLKNSIFELISTRYYLVDSEEVKTEEITLFSFPEEGDFKVIIEWKSSSGRMGTYTIPIRVDHSPPDEIQFALLRGDPSKCLGGDSFNLSLAAEDKQGISYFTLQLKTEEKSYTAHQYNPGQAALLGFNLPNDLSVDAGLYLSVQDVAGNSSNSTLVQQFKLRDTPRILEIDADPYFREGENLRISWNYRGKIPVNRYKINLIEKTDDGQYIRELPEQQMTYLEIPFEQLTSEKRLSEVIFLIRPVTHENEYLEVVSSSILYDPDPPVIEEFTSPEMTSLNSIKVSWNIIEDHILLPPKVKIEEIINVNDEITYNKLNLIQPMDGSPGTNQIDLMDYLDRSDLSENSALRLTLYARDIADNECEPQSRTVFLDSTETPSFSVNDQGLFINPIFNDLVFFWTNAQVDPERGEGTYFYQLHASGNPTPESWTEVVEDRMLTIKKENLSNYEDGTEIHLLLYRQTSFGNESIHNSDGIIIDRSAPQILGVSIMNGPNQEFQGIHYSSERTSQIKVEATDPHSGVNSYRVQMEQQEGDQYRSVSEPVKNDKSLISYPFPSEMLPGSTFRFEVFAFNGLNQVSQPSYSPCLFFSPSEIPEISNIILSQIDGGIGLHWSASSITGLASQSISLYRLDGNSEVLIQTLSPEESWKIRSGFFELPEIQDGSYQVKINVIDRAGLTAEESSAVLIVDNTPPELLELTTDDYIFQRLNFLLRYNEPVNKLEMRLIGPFGELYRQSFYYTQAIKSSSESIILTDMEWLNPLLSQKNCSLKAEFRFYDKKGNPSQWVDKQIFFDSTAPETPSIKKQEDSFLGNNISFEAETLLPTTNLIDGISFSSMEDFSPLLSFRWAVTTDKSLTIPEQQWTTEPILNPSLNVYQENINLSYQGIAEDRTFYLIMETINSAGQNSAKGFSGPYSIDVSPPQFKLSPKNHLNPEIYKESGIALFDGKGEIIIEITEEQNPELEVTTRVYNSSNKIIHTNTTTWERQNKEELIRLESFNYSITEKGVLRVEISLTDPFGKQETQHLLFSNNPGPIIDSPAQWVTRPGFSDSLPYSDWIDKNQDINKMTLHGEGLNLPIEISWGEPLIVTFSHKEEETISSLYNCVLTAEDDLGTLSSVPIKIVVKNTSQGLLCENETWSGTHLLTGVVIVPKNLTLTIAPGCIIEIPENDYSQNLQAIHIEDGGTLRHLGNAHYRRPLGENSLWQGILLKEGSSLTLPQNSIDLITIEGAQRGLTVIEPLTVQGFLFLKNRIGVHLFSENIILKDNLFQQNFYYAIKEENDCNPQMINIHFLNNYIDFYDSNITDQSASELNIIHQGDR